MVTARRAGEGAAVTKTAQPKVRISTTVTETQGKSPPSFSCS
ncbi:hypothetical protein ACFSTG_10685 [Salinimicrobium flavum]|uniref:Uncharacterized protein n=1 Tax=Salinimicrobium flavum TaxID=1737065 RepID=A0ABW5IZ61_9FLAO